MYFFSPKKELSSLSVNRNSPINTLLSPAQSKPKKNTETPGLDCCRTRQLFLVLLRFPERRKGREKSHPNPSSRTKSVTTSRALEQGNTDSRSPPRRAFPIRSDRIRRRRWWRRRSRPRWRCSTAASAGCPRSTASSAPTSSAASRGSAPTRPASTPTSS